MKGFLVALAVLLFVSQQPLPSQHLAIEQLIEIRHPSSPSWSPDGVHVAYLSERAGVANIYVDAKPLTNFLDGVSGGFFWSADSARVYFVRGGDLWQAPIRGGSPAAVWSTPDAETSVVPSPDGTRVAFVRSRGAGSGLVTRGLADGRESLVIRADNRTIGNVSWSPDGRTLLLADAPKIIRHEQTPPYSGSKIIYTINETVPGETVVVPSSGGPPTSMTVRGGFVGRRWLDATHVVFDRQSSDYKRRTISLASISGDEPKTVYEDVDEKFWSIPGGAEPAALPSPDGRWIAFLSDRDGWDHLYVMASPLSATGRANISGEHARGEPIQITKGKFEAWRPAWSRDSARIAFDANEPDRPGDRHIGIATIGRDPSHASVTMITSGRGTDTSPVWSPDGTKIVYQHTDPHNSADLFIVDVGTRKSVRLSDSMPSSIDRAAFVEPELVHYPGPDGQPVPGWLFVPKNLDRTRKHPAIVWIHGDGVNQNYDGWHVQRNYAVYYSYHQYLLQKGYVVFAPDYRGSIGYGRAWRQGVYMDVGGNDAKDAWMAANYLRTLGYVDMDRVGVWGLSYGGFFTLIAVTDQPTLYRAAVDVAGVVDYAMYYEDPYHGGWTASRIGTPEQNPKVYAQASPLSHVDRLARPLLVLHGTSDVNVPYLHSVRLIDELLRNKKGDLVSFMTYPGEFHYFTREHVLRDAWHRVEEFFDAHLKSSSSSTQ
jgi:dipeptidyl aminopeptidase/acylaminoacyl peptidase